MPQENVELVRSIYGLGGGRDALEDAIRHFSPDIEWDFSERVFNPKVYKGHDGVRAWQRELEDVWGGWENHVERIVGAGDTVVAIVRSQGRGRGSGVELSERWAQLWTIKDGVATRVRHYRNPAEALAAAGLSK
jgi:ketosteroid isomerase-like protein